VASRPSVAMPANRQHGFRTTSHEVLRPSSVRHPVNRSSNTRRCEHLRCRPPGSNPDKLPSSAFLRPSRGCSSLSFVALFHTTDAHGVFTLQGVPLSQTSPGSSPGDSLSAFHLSSANTVEVAPPGHDSCESPLPPAEYCIRRRPDTLVSFRSLVCGVAHLWLGASLPAGTCGYRGPSAHGLC
jgi:hypothetical protein